MMKKLIAVSIFVILFIFALPVAHTQGRDVIQVSTPEGLEAVAKDPYGNYSLTADIDMKGVEWTPVAFYGQFNGGGHTICNLTVKKLGEAHAVTVDGNAKTYDTLFTGMFSVVKGAVIKDLTLLNVNVHVSTNENCFAAGLAGFAEDTTISGCTVKGGVYLYQTYHMCGVAGIVGFGNGTISNCEANVELVFVDGDLNIKCEEFLGGILACGCSNISNCNITLKGYASVQGYVHNGGIVGMDYAYTAADKSHPSTVQGCSVDATIFFYENNRDRRAYCKPYVGENLNHNLAVSKNTTVYFKNGETFDYSTVLLPEKCSKPVYTAVVTAPTCTEFGYTTNTCSTCGYTYTDDYILPAHTPGGWVIAVEPTENDTGIQRRYCTVCGKLLEEQVLPAHVPGAWVVEKEPTYEESGLKRLYCKDCTKLLKEEEIPRLVYVSSCKLDSTEIHLDDQSSTHLNAEVLPVNASNTAVVWISSEEHVAKVDAQGNVEAAGRGTATITCTSADGNASSTCTVTVSFTFWQWIHEYILFGWIRS